MGERNFRLINAKCCGSCAELKDDGYSRNYYCDFEEDADFNPEDGGEWQYVCNYWTALKKKISKKNIKETQNDGRNKKDQTTINSI